MDLGACLANQCGAPREITEAALKGGCESMSGYLTETSKILMTAVSYIDICRPFGYRHWYYRPRSLIHWDLYSDRSPPKAQCCVFHPWCCLGSNRCGGWNCCDFLLDPHIYSCSISNSERCLWHVYSSAKFTDPPLTVASVWIKLS